MSAVSFGQTLRLDLGTSYSKLDWKYRVYSDEQQYKSPKMGYVLSAGLEYLQKKYISITSNLSIYQTGGKFASDEQINTYDIPSPDKISIEYVSIGSNLNFNPINDKIKLQLSIGPRLDYIIGGINKDPLKWVDKYDGINKLNWGLTAGIGLYYRLRKCDIGLQAQFINHMEKLADLKPVIGQSLLRAGADAKEQIFIMGASLGYKLR